MAPLTPEEVAAIVAQSALAARYNQPVDPESAHEIITARLTNAKTAAATAAAQAAMRAGVEPTTADGLGSMTPAQQRREIERRAKELAAAQRAAERERKAQERAAREAEKQRQRVLETGIRTAGRVATSRAGQSLLRGVFDVFFGGGKSR
jgi:hypothetical protein